MKTHRDSAGNYTITIMGRTFEAYDASQDGGEDWKVYEIVGLDREYVTTEITLRECKQIIAIFCA